MKIKSLLFGLIFINFCVAVNAQRPRDLGIKIGILKTGERNAITDVPGVLVGQKTIIRGDSVNTGVTAILPHSGNIFMEKIPAAIHIGNGFGKMTGYVQVKELGNIETPIILTNTLSVPIAANALIDYILGLQGNENVGSVNPIVGETNDGGLNDIRNRHITGADVFEAIKTASITVEEGNTGAGTGTSCLGFKGGIGTASRVVPDRHGGYTVGVLVQTNFGGILQINGVPVGIELGRYSFRSDVESDEYGSCMIIVLTNAPLDSRNIGRLASRAMLGLSRTGGIASNGSGDFVIAASTAPELRIPYQGRSLFIEQKVLRNDRMSILFQAVVEATEEAIINSLFAAKPARYRGRTVDALPVGEVLEIMKKYNRLEQ
ncbi:MAG TPA: P1 family peptidase [Bacteroidales bacterium]|nr:P1 family peptidase [Bacteroidales bacterium]